MGRDRWGGVRSLFSVFVGLSLCAACGTPIPEAGPSSNVSVAVSFEPNVASDRVSSVVHVHLASSSLSAGALSLFEGTISSYYLGKFKHGEIPSTLASRQVPAVSFRSGVELVVAPLRALVAGTHSLISVDGLVAQFEVGDARTALERLWPPPSSAASPRFAVYCRPASSTNEMPGSGPLRLEPGAHSVELVPGVDESGLFADRCSHFESEIELSPSQILVPPPLLGDWALAPALFSSGGFPSAIPLDCRAEELELGPGCASVADDRLTVRTPSAPLLWVVHTARGALVEVSAAGSPLTIDGLEPDTLENLWGRTRDLNGAAVDFELEFRSAAARERPILSEALADALGPEPQSEWVEILNDGTLAVDLAQYFFQDGGGRSQLPAEVLAPHEYALLVREDFAPNPSDEPPVAGARLIRLPTLGKAGLSNAGERLALIDRAGVERSVLPALAGKAGQSLARRTPTSEDSDPKSFRFGTPTPGFANDALASAP